MRFKKGDEVLWNEKSICVCISDSVVNEKSTVSGVRLLRVNGIVPNTLLAKGQSVNLVENFHVFRPCDVFDFLLNINSALLVGCVNVCADGLCICSHFLFKKDCEYFLTSFVFNSDNTSWDDCFCFVKKLCEDDAEKFIFENNLYVGCKNTTVKESGLYDIIRYSEHKNVDFCVGDRKDVEDCLYAAYENNRNIVDIRCIRFGRWCICHYVADVKGGDTHAEFIFVSNGKDAVS